MSIDGLSGTLISPRAAAAWLDRHADALAEAGGVAAWAAAAAATLGPATSERRLLESVEDLFERVLGHVCRRGEGYSIATADNADAILLCAFPWSRPAAVSSRDLLRAAADEHAAWIAGFNGIALTIGDARPAAPRREAAFSIDALSAHAATARFAAAILDASALSAGALAGAIEASDASSLEVRGALRLGVQQSLASLTRELPFETGLAVLFRLLFVLFAEARALVPVWHRVYRDHYSLASLALERDARGTWAALEARRRLLGRGCRAGTLHIQGFNGRLFAPGPPRRWARSATLDSRLDRSAAEALIALVEYRPARGGARRVAYGELDVEELGAIYERVLDLDPAGEGRVRKESGSFYTPRRLTEFVVRRTLAPLVDGASADRILSLRVLDPAMGSGAFLVAALRYLASALEIAMIREGRLPEFDVTEADRQQLRRAVAQHCLYGVDANPTAVMLARLSIWLATLSAGRPVGFLDHRLKCGNSLAGIDPAAARIAPHDTSRATHLPLFDRDLPRAALHAAAIDSLSLDRMAEDSVDDVRRKERRFALVSSPETRASAWRALCDLWCAWWFLPPTARADAREYRALADTIVRGAGPLPRRRAARRLEQARACAGRERLFHWPIEFPEVFAAGAPGFDAIVGNPPWEMLRAGSGSGTRAALNAFVRRSGCYPLGTSGHMNLYQLFLERSLQLVRHQGRIGLVMPWGLMTDEGSAPLRRALFDGTRVDTLVRMDNSDGSFQAHRSLRFAAIAATAGDATEAVELTRDIDGRGPSITRAALVAISGNERRVPDVENSAQLARLLQMVSRHRGLGDPAGWGAAFSRELNLTDDRGDFSTRGMPVLEGKHVHPHRVDTSAAGHFISRRAATRLLPSRPFDRPRLAYRDVTAPTNRQTLIAAVVPAGAVTSHSLFCLQNDWDLRTQHALCIILNSAVANMLMRLFVGSHVTTSLMAWLPVPDRERTVSALGGLDPRAPGLDAVVESLYGVI